ncbi:TRAP transporter substrate-binding protein [Jannaschia rubra]|uniref:Extracytoplasmic solute receptor protein YiaO n=1 Tax=Jannaschia rubra TaxID=282197 RepID=A0A0M6XLM0_9RHOB|nr:TRAP transporter substrate-binding protein [Jannaschia rubra]CTQ31989.1 Extracytoplasmic solute receptor protein YiaO [Jannaschia rubra]SFG40491.1 tripartite ATP-independent transporter solute receptor, DctP family [Jannaschia rubra]
MNIRTRLGSFAVSAAAALLLTTGAVNAKNFKIALGDSAGSAQEALGKAFVAALEEKSGGAHTGDLFLNGQLGSEQDTVNEAAMGTLDMSILAINNVTPFSPTVGILTLPYVILSLEEAETLTQGAIGDELTANTIEDAGVRILGWSYTGFRRLTNSVRPVETVEDLQGLVIRVPKNEIMIATYNAWGVNPTPMAWAETFAALQQGVVDGQDNPYLTINAMKFDEVQTYITDIRYIFSLEPLVISEQVFQDLSEEDQQMLIEAGKEATLVSAQFLRDQEEAIKERLTTEGGMEITQPANNEEEFISLATEAVWPQFYDSIGGIEKMNEVLAILGRDPVE